MDNKYSTQDRGNKKDYQQYLEAMDAIAIEKVASASVFFEPKEGNTIVDVGMASGTSTAILAKLFPKMQIIGVDINPKMVQIAQEMYNQPNLSFREDDGERLSTFTRGSVNGFFNCSSIHHITSYNGYDNNKAFNTLQRQVELLKDRGIIVIRDFVKPEEQEIIIELSTTDKMNQPNDADLFISFSKTARSLAHPNEKGFPITEICSKKKDTRKFKAFYTDITEFIRRKDYYGNWEVELQEEYGYFSQKEFEDVFRELGLRIILSSPIYNQWIISHRYKNQFGLYDVNGKEIGFPPTNYLIAGEKVNQGKQIHLVRHLPANEKPFLNYSSYCDIKTKIIYDVVERPNSVSDIIPFYKDGNSLRVLAKHGYPRPLVGVKTDSPILDSKHYSGYIAEGLTTSESDNINNIMQKRFGIDQNCYENITQSLTYYTSPGGINEKVSAKYIELTMPSAASKPLTNGFSGFKESGYLHEYDAAQLLNTAQTGALVEARLELNIYNLFSIQNLQLPRWLGEEINITSNDGIEISSLSELLSCKSKDYQKWLESTEFLTTRRAYFSEMGTEDSNAILEYVYPSTVSSNTLATLPVFLKDEQIYVGLEIRSLPVPQIYSDNSLILTVPAQRLSKDIKNMSELEKYIPKMEIGEAKTKQYSKLGEKYFPSIGLTTEQVYPYVVILSYATKNLKWVSLQELYNNIDKIEDGHLLICLYRFMHSINFQSR